jgi:quercetin dioxygenase-like cupin family protein
MKSFEKSEVYNVKDSVGYSDGAIVSRIVEKNKSGNITLFSFAKGQGLSEHTAPCDALIQITEGSARVTIDKKSLSVHEGEMVIMPANVPHAVEAVDNFKMLLTMIKE